MPNTIEDYIQRIGRTGRAGAKGMAISFFTEKHSRMAGDLKKILYEAKQNVPPALDQFRPGGGGGGGGGGGARQPSYNPPSSNFHHQSHHPSYNGNGPSGPPRW